MSHHAQGVCHNAFLSLRAVDCCMASNVVLALIDLSNFLHRMLVAWQSRIHLLLAGSPMPAALPLGGEVESTAAAAAASAANAAAHAAAAAVMNQPVASVQASTETMEQVSFAIYACLVGVCQRYFPYEMSLCTYMLNTCVTALCHSMPNDS